jgi:hypothetical protein
LMSSFYPIGGDFFSKIDANPDLWVWFSVSLPLPPSLCMFFLDATFTWHLIVHFIFNMLDTDLSGSQLHWYLCLLLSETLPPTSYRNVLITNLLGALTLDMWMWQCFQSTAMQLWCRWHFISCFVIWNQILSWYSFGACGDILFSSLFQAR